MHESFPPELIPEGLLAPSPLFAGRPDARVDAKGWLESKLPQGWNWLAPDYEAIMQMRFEFLAHMRETPGAMGDLIENYRQPWGCYDFIFDWGAILDPRLSAFGKDSEIPFVLFPRQVEFLTWLEGMWMKPGIGLSGKGNAYKTRGCGFSTLGVFWSLWHWLFDKRVDIGWGSNLERNVYSKDNPKALFWKAEHGLKSLPEEFLPKGLRWGEHLVKGEAAGRLVNPETGSTINGDAGKQVGRGDRRAIYIVDEHAFLDFPHLAEAALSKTTNTLIRISTGARDSLFNFQVEGLEKEMPGNLFTYDWWEDPRYTQEQHDRERAEAEDQKMGHIFAVEIDRNIERDSNETFFSREELKAAAARKPMAHGSAIIAVDVAARGRDDSVIGYRRGLWHSPQRKIPSSSEDGRDIAAAVTELAERLLQQDIPIAAVIYELESSGYAVHSVLMAGGLATVCRPIHPGRRVGDGKHYNERARAWAGWRTAVRLGANVPQDQALIHFGSALRYEWRTEKSSGKKLLLLEDKEMFRKRMSADPKNPFGGPSPDECDACALLHVPVQLGEITMREYRRLVGLSGDDGMEFERASGWGWY